MAPKIYASVEDRFRLRYVLFSIDLIQFELDWIYR